MTTTVRTFVYAVRDAASLRIKFGFNTSLDLQAAHAAVLGRYRVSYFECELLRLVPVAVAGRRAEKALKQDLSAYYLAREFMAFPDEATLQRSLTRAYERLACEESTAYTVQSCRGDAALRAARRAARAEAAAAQDAEIKATLLKRKRVVEEREAAKRARLEKPPKVVEQKKEADVQHEVARWVKEHVSVMERAHFTANVAYRHFAAVGGAVPNRMFKQQLQRHLLSHFHPQKRVEGENVKSVYSGLHLRTSGEQ